MNFLKKIDENFELLFLFVGNFSIMFMVVYNYLAEDSFMNLFYLTLLDFQRDVDQIVNECYLIAFIITCLFWIMILIWLKIIE